MSKESKSMSTVVYKLRGEPDLIQIYNEHFMFVNGEGFLISYYLHGESEILNLYFKDVEFINVV